MEKSLNHPTQPSQRKLKRSRPQSFKCDEPKVDIASGGLMLSSDCEKEGLQNENIPIHI